MRTLRALAALALFSSPLHAQDLQRPEGWLARFDREGSTEADMEMWVTMPPGWHITTGPAGIFWLPGTEASGAFRVEMEVFLFDPQERREAFGVFFGGRDLQGDAQAYTYFLLRDGGQFIVKRRSGAETPTVVPWTEHGAIRSYADRGDDASVRNVLTVEAGRDSIRFLVNGEEVTTLPRDGLPVDGTVGIRVNHALNLHVSRLEVTPLG
ncbi:MAG: hypothetical protein AMXMBFR53_26090 [Gemmatimonadota bacterium]